jgi:hypothetical protein
MFDDILTSDFCIAVLHGFNPNVFYELAVAHSAGIPVIMLSEKGVDPPFDLKDERVFYYDLSPRTIFRGDNPLGLVASINSVRELKGRREVPFGNGLIPLNATSVELYSIKPETNATGDFWLQLVSRTRKRLCLAGIGFTGWRGIPGMREALETAAKAGCEIRVLTLDGKNPAFGYMMNPEVAGFKKSKEAPPDYSETRSWFKNALGGSPKSEVRALTSGMLFQQIIIADDQALISPYLFSCNTGHSPRLDIKAGCREFNSFLLEFDTLWRLNGDGAELMTPRD